MVVVSEGDPVVAMVEATTEVSVVESTVVVVSEVGSVPVVVEAPVEVWLADSIVLVVSVAVGEAVEVVP